MSEGKFSAALRGRRKARAKVVRSVPGARPRPKSMRPGYISSSVPNCSATTYGEWFGSITPPAPRRMVSVCAATCAMTSAGTAEATDAVLWCSEYQTRE